MGLAIAAIYCILGLLLLFQTDYAIAQQSRRPSPRSLSTSVRTSSTTSEFDCPEEFGYYPHPSDCTQYYVCVFGGALLESCTGGLMYSHELQTCDWPRNVGCELTDNVEQSASGRDATPRIPQQQLQQTHKFRFSSVPAVSASVEQSTASRTSLGYSIPAQIQTIPPPPELRIAPKPVVTSRGQPKHSIQEDIAKLYAETHDTLPPVEEEESDRQQRVYRGQPSTVSQVQRDRDGILQQSSVNAIPNHGKIGSFAFGSQINQHRVEMSSTPAPSPPVFVQQSQSLPQQPKPAQQQNNRNYYNTTNNQGYSSANNPSQYDSYYSVYDDDIDLYRDVDYVQQFHTNSDKTRQPPPPPPSPPLRASTMSASTTTTASPPPRDNYHVNKQAPAYEKPSQIYNSEYDDALISQLDVNNAYNNQAGRTPLRGDRIELNTISDRPFTTRTPEYSLATYTPTRPTYVQSTTAPTKTSTLKSTPITTNTPPTMTRTNNRNRGGSHYTSNNDERQSTASVNRGTHPPRSRPTLKPSGNIVSKATEFVDIYRFPPTRPDSLYPQPIPDKTAARCRKDVCLLPDCSCGGRDIPGNFQANEIPQIVLLTFDDAVNDINREIYEEIFLDNRTNPNGCLITATFYVSHEWTDYSQVQNLYAAGHEMASHTVS